MNFNSIHRFLPQLNEYFIENLEVQCEVPAYLKFFISLRVAWKTKMDMKKWINEFSKITRSDWIQRDIMDWKSFKYNGAFSGKFVCQHSSHGKRTDSIRDLNCKANIYFNFIRDPSARKRKRVSDMNNTELNNRKIESELWRKGLKYFIRINFVHSHNLESCEGLRMLRSKVDDVYYALFTAGIEPAEAYEIFQRMNQENFKNPINKANASLNPDLEHVQYLHRRYNGAFVSNDYESQLQAIENALIEHYESAGVTLVISKDPFAICIITPLMQRAGLLPSCGEAIFVDFTSAYDTFNHFVVFLFTLSTAGAIPIGCFIIRDLNADNLIKGFELIKNHYGVMAFGSRNCPKYFVISEDLNSEIANALKSRWPASELRCNRFLKLQTVWKWLLEPALEISTDDTSILMQIFKLLISARNPKEAQSMFQEAMESEIVNKYSQFKLFLNAQWHNRKSWCLAYSPLIVDNYFYTFSEASMRSYREIFEHRRPSTALIGIITKIIAECGSHFVEKLMDTALARSSIYLKQSHLIVKNLKIFEQNEQTGHLKSLEEEIGDVSDHVSLVTDGALGENEYETTRYLVNNSAGTCECQTAQTYFICPHLEAVQNATGSTQNLDCFIPILDVKEKTLLIQLATGGGSCSQNLFAPWDVGPTSMESSLFSLKDNNDDDDELIYDDEDENMEEVLIDPLDSQPDEVDVVNVMQNCASSPANNWMGKENGDEQQQPSTSTLYPDKKALFTKTLSTSLIQPIESHTPNGPIILSCKNISETTIMDLTNRFSRRIYDILQRSLCSADNDGHQTIVLMEQACEKLERLRSVKGFQKYFSNALNIPRGGEQHSNTCKVGPQQTNEESFNPTIHHLPPNRGVSKKSKLKRRHSEDEFVVIEDDEEPVIATTK